METKKNVSVSKPESKSLLNKGAFPFLFFLIFGLVYLGVFMLLKDDLMKFLTPENIPVITQTPLGIFVKNPILIGLLGFVLGLLSMIATYVLFVFKLFGLRKVYILNPIFLSITYGIWAVAGRWLLYREPRYTEIGVFIIELVGKPAFYVGTGVLVFCALRFVSSIIFYLTKKSK